MRWKTGLSLMMSLMIDFQNFEYLWCIWNKFDYPSKPNLLMTMIQSAPKDQGRRWWTGHLLMKSFITDSFNFMNIYKPGHHQRQPCPPSLLLYLRRTIEMANVWLWLQAYTKFDLNISGLSPNYQIIYSSIWNLSSRTSSKIALSSIFLLESWGTYGVKVKVELKWQISPITELLDKTCPTCLSLTLSSRSIIKNLIKDSQDLHLLAASLKDRWVQCHGCILIANLS